MSEGNATPEEIYSEHKEAAGALESSSENHEAAKSGLKDARRLHNITESGDFDEGVVSKAKEIHDSAKAENTDARNAKKEAKDWYDDNLDRAKQSVTPELIERAEYLNEMRDKILNALDQHNYGIAKDLLENLTNKKTETGEGEVATGVSTEIPIYSEPTEAAIDIEGTSSPEIKEDIDFINIDTRNCFKPDNLLPEESKRLRDLLENTSQEDIAGIVRSVTEELKKSNNITNPTSREKREHKNQYGKMEQRDLTESVLNARLSRSILSEEESKELREILETKGGSLEIEEGDKRLLELVIKAYKELKRAEQEPEGITKDLYTPIYNSIGRTENDFSVKELSNILLTSDYILKGVRQNRMLGSKSSTTTVSS